MKLFKKIICFIILFSIIFTSGQAFANTAFSDVIKDVELTEEFEKWLELSDKEKSKVIAPRAYEIPFVDLDYSNPIKIAHTVGSSTLKKYDLRDYISENVQVRNQKQTNTCWAFASIGVLESHLALFDFNNDKDIVEYDFSERHMQYSTIRDFKDGKINIFGGKRLPEEGGNLYRSRPYLVNGLGPVKETDMPFVNSQEVIDIEEIQGKTVVAQVYDTVDFPGGEIPEIMALMKEHIRKYGGIEAGVHGASLQSEYYNNKTGAIYCKDSDLAPMDHDVVIIGWDDDYPIENFNENCRPTEKGAWIVKNSWGSEATQKIADLKQEIFEIYNDLCIEKGWDSAEKIPDALIQEMIKDTEYFIRGDEVVMKVGDDGFMYVSYEDINIYGMLTGVEKATNTVNYEKIYQYDELGAPMILPLSLQRVYTSCEFDRNEEDKEFLTEVSATFAEQTTCSVYVNPNGNSKAKKDLIKVELEAGNKEVVGAGYHTLEFKEPIELTSDKFIVVLELKGEFENSYSIPIEAVYEGSAWETAKIDADKSFWTYGEFFNEGEWVSCAENEELSDGMIPPADFTIKAFTTSKDSKGDLTKIEIATPPNKTEYIEGQDFDKTGMVVKAVYEDGSKEEITNYTIENGTNLKLDQEVVMIKYEEKIATQRITVKAKQADEEIKNPELSDFSKAEATAKDIKVYYFTDKNNKEYLTMKVVLDKIERKENDSSEYYYYLSSTSASKEIKDWVKIPEKQSSNTKLEFGVNTKDISNYSEVADSDNLYIHIKEVVKKDDSQKEYISKGFILKKSGEIEVYKDNVKQVSKDDDKDNGNNNNNNNNNGNNNNNNSNNNNNNNNNQNNQKDDTTSPSKLPAAGLKVGIVLIILAVTIFGTIKLIQYKKMNF